MQASDIYLHHVLRQTLMSLDLLEQHAVIMPGETAAIRSKLQATLANPNAGAPGMAPNAVVPYSVVQGGQAGPPLAPPSLPPRQMSGPGPNADPDAGLERAVAQWDYSGTQPDDLNFRKGDIVVVEREANAEWLHGHLANDRARSGLFPRNYVQRLPPNGSPAPPHQAHTPDFNEKASFGNHPPPMHVYNHTPPPGPGPWQAGPPAPPPMGYNNPPSQHPQQVFPYNPPAQQQPQGQPPGAPGVPEKKPSKFGKVGGQLGHSFVNGTGFGAGAAIGGGIVNAIF